MFDVVIWPQGVRDVSRYAYYNKRWEWVMDFRTQAFGAIQIICDTLEARGAGGGARGPGCWGLQSVT